MNKIIKKSLNQHKMAFDLFSDHCEGQIKNAAMITLEKLNLGNKILIFGNGGSASDALHFAAELVGKYNKHRLGIPAIALTANNAILTAIGNDYEFDYIFERQIESLAQKGDVLMGITTSGKSKNIIRGLQKGKELGCITIGLTGNFINNINCYCDHIISVPSNKTPRIQEIHILIAHIFVEIIESNIKF